MELQFGFQPISSIPAWVKFLLYGPAGTGKTVFTAEAPQPYWFDFENSTETLRHYPAYRNIPVKRGRAVLDIMRDVEKLVKYEEAQTVVIDSMTTAHDKYTREHVKAEIAKPQSKRPNDPYTIYEGDYKYATQVFTELFGFLADAPINVVLIGHERLLHGDDENPDKVTGIVPDITPRLQQAVTRLVNVVGYLDERPSTMRESKRFLHVKRTATIEAKNRLNIQQSPIENPTWKELFTDITEIPVEMYEEPEEVNNG